MATNRSIRYLLFFVPFVISILLLNACKKENSNLVPEIDFRQEFEGQYACNKLCTYWTLSQPQIDTLYNDTATLVVTIDPSDPNKLIVGIDTIQIGSSGTYSGFNNPIGYKNYSIEFRSDSVFLSTFQGGLGGGTTCSTTGVRAN